MYLDLVVLAYGNGADVVLPPQFFAQPGRHGLSEHVRGDTEMIFETLLRSEVTKGWTFLVTCEEHRRR